MLEDPSFYDQMKNNIALKEKTNQEKFNTGENVNKYIIFINFHSFEEKNN